MTESSSFLVERVQTGVRMEKRLLKVLKGFAEYHDLTLGDLLEGIVLHAFDGKTPFSQGSLNQIKELKHFYALEALHAFSSALQRFAAAHGKSKLYHETITWAYIFLIRERMARAARTQNWEEFAEDNPDLLTWKGGVLDRFYREETLRSDLARGIFIFPDKYVEREP